MMTYKQGDICIEGQMIRQIALTMRRFCGENAVGKRGASTSKNLYFVGK